MRIWLIRIGVILPALFLCGLLAGASFESASRAKVDKEFPHPGRLVDIGGRRIQLDCRGAGSPIVVFESGLDTLGALSWSAIHDQVALTTRACAYSRAGVTWSDPAPGPFNVAREASDLHTALANAREKGPYVMVGHSLGGPYLLNFTNHYPDDVAGLVFVDASHPDQQTRLATIAGKPMDAGARMAHIGSALSGLGILRLALPEGLLPKHLPVSATNIAAALFPASLPAAAAEMDGLTATLATAGQYRSLGTRPLVVLTRGERTPPEAARQLKISALKVAAIDTEWLAMQSDEASWSTSSRHQVVPGASHYIQLDRPQVVIDAVGEVVEEVRAQSRN